MANSNNKHASGLISKAFGVAKKLSTTGLNLANHVAPGSIAPLVQTPDPHSIIDIHENENTMTEKKHSENPQQLFRNHVPKVTQQLLGRHYGKVNHLTSFISPNINDKIADFFFDKLNDFVSASSSVEHVLKEVGAKELTELAKDPARSDRIAQALANQNKTLAAVQGALTGATGVIGTAIDIPLSLALTLRTIYQSGRAHGFELNRAKEQEVVEYVFREVDLGSIAEKQTLLIALRAFSNVVQTQDTRQLQNMLGSSNDFEKVRQWLSHQDGTFKWSWLNHIPQISILSKLTPLAGAGIGAVYSWKLVEEANIKAQYIFSNAQQYLLQHPNDKLDVLAAFEKSIALAQTKGLLNAPEQEAEPTAVKLSASEPVNVSVENDAIRSVRIEAKHEGVKAEAPSVEEGIKQLAEKHVHHEETHLNVVSVKSNVNEVLPDETEAKGEALPKTQKISSNSTAKKKPTAKVTAKASVNEQTSSITKNPKS